MMSILTAPPALPARYLALGDSYTIGESVPAGARWPNQLAELLRAEGITLADPEIIDALYRASRAGVRIQLNIRGVCMLVPGVPKQSENITVVSVIDRFLEHSRIFWFANGGADELYLSSADWMPRNLDRRVELLFPILAEGVKATIKDVLQLYFADNVKSHFLMPNGSWLRRSPEAGEQRIRVQELLYEAEKRRTELYEQEPQREFIVRRAEP